MKKYSLLICLLWPATALLGAAAPDNMFMRALNDEMQRTKKELRLKGSPAPFFIGYYIFDQTQISAQGTFGQVTWPAQRNSSIQAAVLLSAGDTQNDSWGLNEKTFVQYDKEVARSYAGLRQALWSMTDRAYTIAIDAYDTKQAFKRNKNITNNLPDFIPAKKVNIIRPVTSPDLLPAEQITALAQTLSDWGKDKAFVENYNVLISQTHTNSYYLNNEGSSFQKPDTHLAVTWYAKIRTQTGFVRHLTKTEKFVHFTPQAQEEIEQLTRQFRRRISEVYGAKKAESYLGPVLLKPAAAAWVLRRVFVKNITNLKPLLDTSAQQGGNFRDKTGKRVMSKLINVYDKPLMHQYNNRPLSFTGYLDDEGVEVQELVLAQGGKIKELPRSRRPFEKNAKSNGHGFSSETTFSFPREDVTNVFVEAIDPQTTEQLEAQLLAKCREMDLEYCYILNTLPNTLNAQRIYTSDGHRENVFGLNPISVTPRTLRDIVAAGDDPEVTDNGRMVTPSLLLEELEFIPDTEEPEKPPFVARP